MSAGPVNEESYFPIVPTNTYFTSMYRTLCPPTHLGILLALIFLGVFEVKGSDYVLTKAYIENVPVVNDKRVSYQLALVFNSCPENYWMYYNKKKEQIVVDIYGVTLSLAPNMRVFHENLFRGISVVNQPTRMSLEGTQAFIRIGAAPGWHFEATTVNSTTMRITAWKFYETPKPKTVKKNGPLLYVLSGAGALVVAFGLVIAISGALQ
jgi:hypothetical protein